ncbi:MAG: sodium:solute symporter family protein [Candidatus Neomarinimicrobiota bacterium]
MNGAIHPADLSIVVLYFVILMGVGIFRSKRRPEGEKDYLLVGRKLSLLPFTASLVATWYGGILGVGEFTYLYGLSSWIVFGLPYYVFALMFAFFLASRIRSTGQTTIPDRFYPRYGRIPGILSSVYVMILSSPAPYILSVSLILQLLFGIGLLPALLISTLFSLVYIYHGGFRSVIRTDLFQFVLMFIGFGVVAALSAMKFGGFSFLKESVPRLHLTWTGSHSTFYILVWFFIALWTFVDPGFYQRCAAAESPATAKRGILLSIGFWAIFDFLTLSTGLYARAILPGLQNPMMAIPSLGLEILPPVLMGLFFAGILSTIMSTVDSLGFISAITFGRDIMWRNRPGGQDSVRWTKIGLVVTGALSLLLAWFLPSVVKLWYAIGSIAVPGLLIPFLTTFRRKTVPGMKWLMSLPAGISLAWFLAGVISGGESPAYPLGIEPFYPGLAVSIVGSAVSELIRRG